MAPFPTEPEVLCLVWLMTDLAYPTNPHGRPQTFFQGGQEPTFCLKTTKKILFFPKKSKNILFLAGLGRQGGQEPPLPSPADAHANPNQLLFFQIMKKEVFLFEYLHAPSSTKSSHNNR